jgi:hypothetical protein
LASLVHSPSPAVSFNYGATCMHADLSGVSFFVC